MQSSKIAFLSFLNSIGVLVYVFLVVLIMNNFDKGLGKTNPIIAGMSILLLFIVSASITSLLVLGRPIYLYINGMKKEGIKMLFFTIGFLFLYFLGAIGITMMK